MLENTFTLILNMSITASIAAALIMIFRWVFGSRFPKIFGYTLWAIVLVRLLIPLSFPSMFSVFNAIHIEETITYSQEYHETDNRFPNITQSGVVSEHKIGSELLNSSFPAVTPVASVDPIQVLIFVFSCIWLTGAAGLFLFSIYAYLRSSRRVNEAVLYKNNNLISQCRQKLNLNREVQIYTSDRTHTPVVCGLIKPRVIIPLKLTEGGDELELKYIITHELVHIKRFDYILKPLSVLAVLMHWFNPIVWLSFMLSQKDMEMACDEKVISVFDTDVRSEYASSLVKLTVKANVMLNGGLLAFGESNIKSRIKGIMRFKKTGLLMGITSIIILIAIGSVLLTNAQNKGDDGKNQQNKSGVNTNSKANPTSTEKPTSTDKKKDSVSNSIDNPLWVKDGWTYYLEPVPRGGVIPLDNLVGKLCRHNSEGIKETIDELVTYRNGRAVVFPAGERIVFKGFAGTGVMDFKSGALVSIREDGSDRKTFDPEYSGSGQLCYDKGYLFFEGWTNDGAFPRPVCRMDTEFKKNIKMADIDGTLITVFDGYAYYLNGSIYRLKLDWSSKPEIWDKAAIGKKIVSLQKTADNEYNVVYDENSKPYILRLPDEKRKAFNVIQKYFSAFENADYSSMKALATENHNKNLVHNGDVWGMVWARAKEIKLVENTGFLRIENPESTLVYGVSVDMETAKTSAQYPSTDTFFYVILVKEGNGAWRVDGYTTG